MKARELSMGVDLKGGFRYSPGDAKSSWSLPIIKQSGVHDDGGVHNDGIERAER